MPLSGTLTKAKIIDAVAEKIGFTRRKSIETVEILFEIVKKSLESGDRYGHDAETPAGCHVKMLGEAAGVV